MCIWIFLQVSRLRLPRHYGDDCQLLAFGVDGGSLEAPTFDGTPWNSNITSGSLHRMCRQTRACLSFRLIKRRPMPHFSQVCRFFNKGRPKAGLNIRIAFYLETTLGYEVEHIVEVRSRNSQNYTQ